MHRNGKTFILAMHPYMSLWTFSRARAAKPMFFKTSVLVCEFSRASRWNSMVDSVPSIWTSCCSRRFFFFKARRAAGTEKSAMVTFHHLSPFGGQLQGLGIHKEQIQIFSQCLFLILSDSKAMWNVHLCNVYAKLEVYQIHLFNCHL